MNALQLVKAMTAEMGLPQPSVLKGNTAQDVVQLFSLLNAVGRELQREYDWQALCTEYRFTTQYLVTTGTISPNSAVVTGVGATTGLDSTYMVTGTGISQDTYVKTNDSSSQVTLSQVANGSGVVALTFCKTKYSFPADYDRPIDKTQWDKTRHWDLQGPQTAQQWQWLKSGYVSTGPRMKFRQFSGYFQTWPPMASAETLGMEYVSNTWASSSDGATKASAFITDNDICIFPDDLMIVALKKKYCIAKGFPPDYDLEYAGKLSIAKANDSGSDTLSMAPRQSSMLIGLDNMPDSGFGV